MKFNNFGRLNCCLNRRFMRIGNVKRFLCLKNTGSL
jgi:hypothetical protein